MIQILRVIKGDEFQKLSTVLEVHCKAFEEKSGDLELAYNPKMRPRTNHINQVYHNFRNFVGNVTIKIFLIKSHNQITVIFLRSNYHTIISCDDSRSHYVVVAS